MRKAPFDALDRDPIGEFGDEAIPIGSSHRCSPRAASVDGEVTLLELQLPKPSYAALASAGPRNECP